MLQQLLQGSDRSPGPRTFDTDHVGLDDGPITRLVLLVLLGRDDRVVSEFREDFAEAVPEQSPGVGWWTVLADCLNMLRLSMLDVADL